MENCLEFVLENEILAFLPLLPTAYAQLHLLAKSFCAVFWPWVQNVDVAICPVKNRFYAISYSQQKYLNSPSYSIFWQI